MSNGSVVSVINLPKWRPWREFTLIMLMIMEVSWVVPWFRSLTPASYTVGALKAFVIFFSMMLLAHLIIRLLNYLRLKIKIRQSIMVVFLIVSILIGYKYLLYPSETRLLELINRPIQSFSDWGMLIPDEFIVALAVIIGWWRGISFAQVHIGPHLVMNNFVLGIFMFFLFGFINTIATGETPGILLYLFIFSSLLAMSSSRMFVIHTLRGGGERGFDRKWFGGITFAALAIVLITGLSSYLFGEESGLFGYLLTGLFYLASLLLYALLFPVLLLFIWLFEKAPIELKVLQDLSGSLSNLRSMMQNAITQLGDLINQSGIAKVISDWSSEIKAILFWGLIILALGGFTLWVGLQLWGARDRRIRDEDYQSTLESKDIWKLIRSSLEDRLKNIWGSIAGLGGLSGFRRMKAAERIRQIYIDLMEMCLMLNTPRPEAATPIEFMPKMVDLLPNCKEDIEVITRAYNRIRYGQLPEQHSEITTVESAWRNLEREGKILLELEGKKKIKNLPK